MPATGRSVPPAARTARKVRSSVVYCNEKYACAKDRAEAVFACEECRTNQCENCEQQLHNLSKYAFHDRIRIPVVNPDRLCSQPESNGCNPRNYADVVCEDCDRRRFCFNCETKVHRGRLSSHRRVPIFESLFTPPLVGGKDDCPSNESVAVIPADGLVSQYNNENDNSLFVSVLNGQERCEDIAISSSPTNEQSLLYLSLPDIQEGEYIQPKGDNAVSECASVLRTAVTTQVSSDSFTDAQSDQVDCTVAEGIAVTNDNQSSVNVQSVGSKSNGGLTTSLQSSVLSPQDEDYQTSFLLANQFEELMVHDEEEFLQQLHCESDILVKVVSVCGKTGVGKSHLLNQTFFDGNNVFSIVENDLAGISASTKGVKAAFDGVHNAVIVDTEGWVGTGASLAETLHMRHLFKVFAVSDVVVIYAKSEHLHSDLFHFISNMASIYHQYVASESGILLKNMTASMGAVKNSLPAIIVFHETVHTDILAKGAAEPAEKILRSRFVELGLNCDEITTLQYVGTRTTDASTDCSKLLLAVKRLLNDRTLRPSRHPSVVFKQLKMLYQKFSGSVELSTLSSSADELCLRCKAKCLSCSASCKLSMNHERDGTGHASDTTAGCEYQKQFDNRVHLCKMCLRGGQQVIVTPKSPAFEDSSWMSLASYAWSGYVLECRNCGVIYRSRQHWFGNVEPERSAVVTTEIRHVWPGSKPPLQVNVGRHILDSLTYVSDTVAAVSATPAKVASDWFSDRIAPAYWVPNSELTNCKNCKKLFDTETPVHHCRACGNGFCDKCTSKRRAVPERGWGSDPVRVCDNCADVASDRLSDSVGDEVLVSSEETMPRRVGEVVGATVGTLASVISYPFAVLRDAARPDYWVPDESITNCCVCTKQFTSTRRLHHCRACGQGVCSTCSPMQRPVPSRGWHHPVRVCKTCDSKNS